MPGILLNDYHNETYFVVNHSSELESACKRGILELIIPQLRTKFKKYIQVTWPTEVREEHNDYSYDFTHAHIAIKNPEPKAKAFFADVRLHFDAMPGTLTVELSNNEHRSLRVGTRTVGYPLQYQTQHISLTDPDCHLKAIRLISDNIIQFTRNVESP